MGFTIAVSSMLTKVWFVYNLAFRHRTMKLTVIYFIFKFIFINRNKIYFNS